MPDEIKNCPFCNTLPSVDSFEDSSLSLVACRNTGCPLIADPMTVEQWNTRPAESRLETELLSLRKSSHSVSQCCPESERLAKRVEELVDAAEAAREWFVGTVNRPDWTEEKKRVADRFRAALAQAFTREAAAESLAARGAGR